MDSLADRVKARTLALYGDGRFTQAALAECLGVDPSAAQGYVKGTTRISLKVLEAVSIVSGEPLAELVVPPGSLIKQVNADEAALLRALRSWPLSVTRALGVFVAYFADEPPALQQTRKMHEHYKNLDVKKREQLLSIAQLLDEGVLGPDLLGALQERLLDDRLADAGETARRKRTTRDNDKQP